MKIFVRVVLFLVVALLFYQLLLSKSEVKISNSETESNLPVIEKNTSYDFVLLGSSHARIFSRFKMHNKVEESLHKTFVNLSQGGNRESLKNQKNYLTYFYQRGNRSRITVYFLDPFIFYRRELLSNSHIFDYEPFRIDFLYTLLSSGDYNWDTLASYTLAFSHSKVLPPTQIKQGTVSAQLISARLKTLYLDPIDMKEIDYLKEIIELSKVHGAKVIVIIPPTLFPKHKQSVVVKEEINMLQKTEHFALYDFSEVMQDPKYFYDSDHLNTVGISYFIQRYLRPALTI